MAELEVPIGNNL